MAAPFLSCGCTIRGSPRCPLVDSQNEIEEARPASQRLEMTRAGSFPEQTSSLDLRGKSGKSIFWLRSSGIEEAALFSHLRRRYSPSPPTHVPLDSFGASNLRPEPLFMKSNVCASLTPLLIERNFAALRSEATRKPVSGYR
jgi:hypothetical protein